MVSSAECKSLKHVVNHRLLAYWANNTQTNIIMILVMGLESKWREEEESPARP
jgi:hypothetical protein